MLFLLCPRSETRSEEELEHDNHARKFFEQLDINKDGFILCPDFRFENQDVRDYLSLFFCLFGIELLLKMVHESFSLRFPFPPMECANDCKGHLDAKEFDSLLLRLGVKSEGERKRQRLCLCMFFFLVGS
jgi:hypothetical protein